MVTGPTAAFAHLSDAIVAQIAAVAPMLVAIRTGHNRHINGILWQQDLVVTSDQALPAQDSFTLVGSGGLLTAARPSRRNAAVNLVSLRLDAPANPVQTLAPAEPRVGSLALAVAADADAAPLARLTMIHKVSSGGSQPTLLLDLATDLVPEGGPVVDASGGLLGMAVVGTTGEATVIPYATITRMLEPQHGNLNGRRGWLGVALQPITVPEALRATVGQGSGRMVVSVVPSGPAELAGIRPGDILLSLDGHGISGAHTLRATLGPERIGRQVEIRLLRDGQIDTCHLTVAPQPTD
jgi:hypothetical protein